MAGRKVVRRGSTPRLTLRVCADLAGAERVDVSLGSRSGVEVVDPSRLSVAADADGADGCRRTRIGLTLTQGETLGYETGETVSVQVRYLLPGETVPVSSVGHFDVGVGLDERVL